MLLGSPLFFEQGMLNCEWGQLMTITKKLGKPSKMILKKYKCSLAEWYHVLPNFIPSPMSNIIFEKINEERIEESMLLDCMLELDHTERMTIDNLLKFDYFAF